MDHPSETSLRTVAPSSQTPLLRYFSGGRGRLYTGYLERIIQSSKVRRIVHSKLKLFHFQINTYCLSDANHQADNPSHTNNPSLVWKRPFLLQRMSHPDLELGVCVSAFAFSQGLFWNWLLTFLCVKYIRSGILYKKCDLSNVKIFQKNSLFHPEMIRRPLFGFRYKKSTV